VRFALILVWLAAAWFVARVLLRHLAPLARSRRPAGPDELVKDPVCQTYVVRSRAVTRGTGGEVRYFCSEECAGRASRV
jgi:hypothetical protein